MTAKTTKTKSTSEKRVRAAVPKLEKDDERATTTAVPEHIDGGSVSDHSQIMLSIATEKVTAAGPKSHVPEVPKEVLELAIATWEAAYKLAAQAIAAERRALAEEVKALQERIADQEAAEEILKGERDAALARAEDAEGKLTEVIRDRDEARFENARLEVCLQECEEAKSENGENDKASRDPDETDVPIANDDRQEPVVVQRGYGDATSATPDVEERHRSGEIRIAVGEVVLYLDASTPAGRIAEIVHAIDDAS